MIILLDHTDIQVARKIRDVFQRSYKVEAELLGAIDFPPLKRPIEAFTESDNLFYGFVKEGEVQGVVELLVHTDYLDIQSLVVSPKFFRQGIGRRLMEYALKEHPSSKYVVETGKDNFPALQLYRSLGFEQVDEWDTDHNVVKVKLHRL